MGLLISKYSLLSVMLLIPVVTASLDYVDHDKRTKGFKRSRSILFACFIIAGVLTFIFTYFDDKSKSEEDAEKRKENAQLREQISALQVKADNLNGGEFDGFVFPDMPASDGSFKLLFCRRNNDIPMFNISVTVIDHKQKVTEAELANVQNFDPAILHRGYTYYRLGDMAPRQSLPIATIKFDESDYVSLSFIISANNGNGSQRFSARIVKGQFLYATIATRNSDQHEIFKFTKRDFPVDEHGNPKW